MGNGSQQQRIKSVNADTRVRKKSANDSRDENADMQWRRKSAIAHLISGDDFIYKIKSHQNRIYNVISFYGKVNINK